MPPVKMARTMGGRKASSRREEAPATVAFAGLRERKKTKNTEQSQLAIFVFRMKDLIGSPPILHSLPIRFSNSTADEPRGRSVQLILDRVSSAMRRVRERREGGTRAATRPEPPFAGRAFQAKSKPSSRLRPPGNRSRRTAPAGPPFSPISLQTAFPPKDLSSASDC